MKRAIAILLFIALSGCTPGMRITSPKQGVVVSTLVINAPRTQSDNSTLPSVYSVDRTSYALESKEQLLFLSPGKHRLGVNCNKSAYAEKQPRVTFHFEVSKKYEVYCNGETPALRELH